MITILDRVCQQCEASFLTPAWRVKQGKGKFCSKHCHNDFQRGKPSPTSPEKLSQAQKASYQRNPERAVNNSKIMKELWQDPEFRKKALENRDTPEAKEKHFQGNSEAAKRMWQNPESRTKIIESRKRAYQSPEYRSKRSELSREMWQNPDYVAALSCIHKKLWQDPDFIKIMSEAQSKAAIKRWQNPDYRDYQIESAKKRWQNPEFVRKMFLSLNKRPTNPEKQLEAILIKHLPEFKYNGDGRLGVTLGGLTPDFVNVNGKKAVIEVFGDYYHSPEVLGDRWQGSELGKIMIYNSLGWRCLVIWASELKQLSEDEVVAKVNAFSKRR